MICGYRDIIICLTLYWSGSVATAQTPACLDTPLSATGRQQLTVSGGAETYGSVRFTYRTTGSPTGVSISIEAGNVAAATQTPFEQITALTNTGGAHMGTAAAGWRFWFANVATLAGGTSPTIILTSCFHPSAFSATIPLTPSGESPFTCNQTASVALTAAGNTQLVAAVAGQRIRVCHLSLSFVSMVDFSLHEGTGVACATGDTAITGTYQDILTVALDPSSAGAIRTASGQALCANLGVAVTGGGVITYAQF